MISSALLFEEGPDTLPATPDPAPELNGFPPQQFLHLCEHVLTCYNKIFVFQGVITVPEVNQHGQTVNDIVPGWKGARVLSRTPLSGRVCRLEPLDAARHAHDLFEAYALGDDSDWTWLASTQPESMEATAHWLLGKVMDDALVPYAVIDLRTGRAVGLMSYMAIDRQQGTAEIGHVTWSRRMKQTAMGTESVWLLLKNAFEHDYRRLEWRCDSMNVASRRAAERLGFVWEGRLRNKLVRKARNRDSDILSIIESEWPERDAELRAWLAPDNFDAQGQQIRRLAAFR